MIAIRKAEVSDIETLVGFQINLALETENIKLDRPTLQDGMRSLFNDPSKGMYYVAQHDDEVVGCHMITFEWSDWRNGMVWWLQSVYVKASYRNKGVFKKMYDNIIDMIMHNPKILGVRLYVDKRNERAMKVYAAMGMDGSHYTVYEWMR